MSELKETKKMKIIALYEQTPKKAKKKLPFNQIKLKINPKFKSKSNVKIEGNKENKSMCTI